MNFYLFQQEKTLDQDLQAGRLALPAEASAEEQALFAQLTEEDLIFSLAGDQLVALATPTGKPEGQEVAVEYSPIDPPLSLADCQEALKGQDGGAFTAEGQLKGGNLFLLPEAESDLLVQAALETLGAGEHENDLLKDVAFALGNLHKFSKSLH